MTWTITALVTLVVTGSGAAVVAYRRLAEVVRDPDGPDGSANLVRAIRALVLVACAALFIGAIVTSSRTLSTLAAIILGEEIYETAVALLILRAGHTPQPAATEPISH
jgi:hypothetical protein